MDYLSLLGLSIFKTVVDLGSFRAAATQLKISQPAVSAHIHRIEKYLNIRLFERPYKRKLQPTEAGLLLYDYAVDIAAKGKEFKVLLDNLSKGQLGEVRLALSICKNLFSSIIASYTQDYPNVSLIFRSGNSVEVKRLVQQGKVDFGITNRVENDPNFTYQPLYQEPMELFCSVTHPLADKRIISVDDLLNHRLVTCLEGSDYNNKINNFLNGLGIKIKHQIQVEDGTIVSHIVEKGVGIGILSHSSIENSVNNGKVVTLLMEDGIQLPITECQLIFRKNTRLSNTTITFLEYLKENVKIYSEILVHSGQNKNNGFQHPPFN